MGLVTVIVGGVNIHIQTNLMFLDACQASDGILLLLQVADPANMS